MNEFNPKRSKGLFELVSELPGHATDLVKAEIAAYKAELIRKGKSIGFGAALFAAAAFLLFWVVAVLIASAIMAFALVLPGWAAALVVAAILLLIILLLVFIGLARVKAGAKTEGEPIKEAIQHDVEAVKGEGVYE